MRKRGSTVRNKSDISSADVLLATTSLLQKRGTVSGGGGSAAALLPHGNAAFRPSGGWRSEAVRTAVETALRTSSNRVCADCAAHLTTKSVGHHVVRLDQRTNSCFDVRYMLARSLGIVLCPECAKQHIDLAGTEAVFLTGSHGASIIPIEHCGSSSLIPSARISLTVECWTCRHSAVGYRPVLCSWQRRV